MEDAGLDDLNSQLKVPLIGIATWGAVFGRKDMEKGLC